VAYDEELADRVRDAVLGATVEVVERSMFGGLAFMVRGHMTVGVLGTDLLVRVGPDAYEDALTRPSARPRSRPSASGRRYAGSVDDWAHGGVGAGRVGGGRGCRSDGRRAAESAWAVRYPRGRLRLCGHASAALEDRHGLRLRVAC